MSQSGVCQSGLYYLALLEEKLCIQSNRGGEYLTAAGATKITIAFRGNSCLPSAGEASMRKLLFIYYYYFLTFFSFFSFFSFFCQPLSCLLLLPADRQPLRSRVGFYHLVAGLLNPGALLIKAKFSNLPVPIGQDLRNSQFSCPT